MKRKKKVRKFVEGNDKNDDEGSKESNDDVCFTTLYDFSDYFDYKWSKWFSNLLSKTVYKNIE